jgi:hypothetical protein
MLAPVFVFDDITRHEMFEVNHGVISKIRGPCPVGFESNQYAGSATLAILQNGTKWS